MIHTRSFVIAPALLVLLAALDLITTQGAIDAGATEGNPLVAPWIENWWAVFVKIGWAAIILGLTIRYIEKLTVRMFALSWMAVGVYLAAVTINIVTWATLAA